MKEPVELAVDQVPNGEILAGMEVEPGECLGHVNQLLKLSLKVGKTCQYVVCMGPITGRTLHCWLENGSVVADLTRLLGPRFYDRDEYYSMLHVEAGSVKRYTYLESILKLLGSDWTPRFWDFDVSQYDVAPVKGRLDL